MDADTRASLEDLLFKLTPASARGGAGKMRYVLHQEKGGAAELWPPLGFTDDQLAKKLQAFGFNALSPHFHPSASQLLDRVEGGAGLDKTSRVVALTCVLVCLTEGFTDDEVLARLSSLLKRVLDRGQR